jgi:EAL domain-containing protein (putative c-di-GMP-specific phosphodiesterase class I)
MPKSSTPPPSNRLSDAPSATSTVADEGPDSRRALEDIVDPEELWVVFQPIVELATGNPCACEALIRCHHQRFTGPPALFEHASRSGCVGRLGRLIREVAVPLSCGKRLFLNIHPHELSERWLVRPDDPIFAHDADVFLEITEEVPLMHFELCLSVVHELRHRGGIHLVVDDLGAGYSNLKSIADLEPKVVKLDRRLVAGLDRNPRQQRLVTGVVRLCGDLGAQVVGEGVETLSEYTALLDTGTQFGQGFLFARPGYPLPPVTWPPVPS